MIGSQEYLQSNGAILAQVHFFEIIVKTISSLFQDPELMPFFALPYVPNPAGNASFRQLYQVGIVLFFG